MTILYFYWLLMVSICLGCNEVADVIFVLDGSDSVSSTDFLHEVTFVASGPAQYEVPSANIRFGAILYGSQVSNKISIVPSTESNQFVNKVTEFKQTGGKPLLFRALTELRREFSNNYRKESRRVAIVIISDKLHNRSVVLREIRFLRSAGVITIPIGVGVKAQEKDLKDLLTFENPIYQINNFSEIYQLSQVIYNTVCEGKTTLSGTTSLPLPESQLYVETNTKEEHSKNDTFSANQLSNAKQLKYELRRAKNPSLDRLQIEVPELREMVDKRPSIRPYFINYSLLGTRDSKRKNKELRHDSAKSFKKTGKKVTGIIIKNEIWASTSTPATKTFAREKPWTTKTSDKPMGRKKYMEWMAKGVDDFKTFLKNLEKPIHKNTGGSKLNSLFTTKINTNVDVSTPSKSKTDIKKQVTDTRKVKSFVITHYNNSFSAGKPTRNPTISKHRSSLRKVTGTKSQDGTRSYPNPTKQSMHNKKVNSNITTTQQPSLRRHKHVNHKTQKPYTKRYRELPKRNRHIPNVNTVSKFSGNSISSEKTDSATFHAQVSEERSVYTDNIVSGRQVRPIFTLTGSIDRNVFSGGNSLQLPSTDDKQNRGKVSKNGLSQNRIVHERPQISSKLYSPSNEFYIENGVNSISYKQHYKKLLNQDAKSDDSIKAPYIFDGSKIYATGTTGPLFLSHEKNYHESFPTQFPTTPVTQSRENKEPFYLTGPNDGHLTPSIIESSTQASMFNTEKLTTRHANTFPPNFLELLGISLEGTKKQAGNLKSSPFSSLPQKTEKYHQQDINVHFYRQSSYLPSPWGEPSGVIQDLPLRPFRQMPGEIGLSFSGGNFNCQFPDCGDGIV